MTMLVSEQNRLGTAIGAVSPRAVSPRIEAHIAWLEQELSDLDKPQSTEKMSVGAC